MEQPILATMKMMENDRFATANGIVIDELGEGFAKASMEVTPQILNGVGTVQGGALFTLADFCFATAANSYGVMTVSLDANISFIKAVKSGKLTATAKEIFRRRTVAGYNVEIKTEDDELVCVFNTTAYIKN